MNAESQADSIRNSLLEHDREFQKLLCMIPSKYYISPLQPSTSEETGFKNKAKQNNKKHKMSAEDKRLQKRARFDPDIPHAILQLQGPNDRSPIASISTSTGKDQAGPPLSSTNSSNAPQLSRLELQAKLQHRIVELQHSGTAPMLPVSQADTVSASASSGGAPSPPAVASKDALLELGRQKRGEMRDRRRRERKETRRREKKLKEEQILLAKKRKGLSPKKEKVANGSGNLLKGLDVKHVADKKNQGVTDTRPAAPSGKRHNGLDAMVEEAVLIQADASAKEPTLSSATKPRLEATNPGEPELTFSSLAFETGLSQSNARHHSKNPSWTSKNPVEAKLAADRRQAYLDKLTPEARERAEESKKWEKAGLQASGTKVMDDPKKLEKALKRQTKEKRKRREAWNDRTKAVEKLQEDKQKKRRDNIEKRKEQIRDKRKGGVKAKGNIKSGFGAEKGVKKSVKGF